MSEWQRGCSLDNQSEDEAKKGGANSRNFERERGSLQDQTAAKSSGFSSGRGGGGHRDRGRDSGDSRPCHAFQRGECRHGNDCRYLHQQLVGKACSAPTSATTTSAAAIGSLDHIQPTSQSMIVQPPTLAAKKMKCPPALFRSRDLLFKGISLAQRRHIVMDTVASFSVTESQMADKMTDKILQLAENVKPHNNVIFDGMACVG